MNAKRLIGLLFFSVCFITNILAQANIEPSLAVSHEKVYIHFDRPYYTAGETIWFKAYLFNKGLPSMLSTEFYLQLEDGRGNIVSKQKYPVSGASASGNIILSDTLLQGYYLLKAITKTIARDDIQFQYKKNLFIFNPADPATKTADAKKTISLRFFAESGHLIDRIKTQVAFKANDESGKPIAINGIIKSDSTTVLTSFKSSHDGIGKIAFTPHLSDILFAEVEMNGNKYKFSLPKVEETGIYLKVADADSGKIFEITRSKKDNNQFDTVKVIVMQNDDTVFQTTLAFGNEQTLKAVLKTGNLASGILHFKILNKEAVPLAERLSFVNNKEYLLQPELLVVKRDSSKRAANSFELKFNDNIQHSFSISVTDFTAQEFPDKENICSRLLLTSDLRGYVYNPAYYFESDDAEHKLALDNLMLTHGWTRYNSKKKLSEHNENKIEDQRYLISISGVVTDLNQNKPLSNGNLNLQLFTEDSIFQSYETAVDKEGRFKIDSLVFFGNAKIIYSYTSGNGKKIPVNLLVDKDLSDELFSMFASSESVHRNYEKSETDFIENKTGLPGQLPDPKFKQLSTVFLKTKVKRPEEKMNEKYASPLFRSTGRLVLDNINKPYPNQSLDVVNFALTNIRTLAYDREFNSFVNKKNFSMQTQKNWIVEVLVDEAVSSVDMVKTITMERVAMIKFYESGFVGVGMAAPGGALAIYLKKYEDNPLSQNKIQQAFFYKGYSVTQDFYSPDYSIPVPSNTIDNRLTIYWETANTSMDTKDIKFSFFNNDISKKLHIVVEGFDAQGRLIRYEKDFGE